MGPTHNRTTWILAVALAAAFCYTPLAGAAEDTATRVSPADRQLNRSFLWMAARPEVSAFGHVLPRVELGFGGIENRSMIAFTSAGGPLLINEIFGAAADVGLLLAGRLPVKRGDLFLGARMTFDLVYLPNDLNFGELHLMGTLGGSMAYMADAPPGKPRFRIAFEPGVVVPWMVPTFGLSIGILLPASS